MHIMVYYSKMYAFDAYVNLMVPFPLSSSELCKGSPGTATSVKSSNNTTYDLIHDHIRAKRAKALPQRQVHRTNRSSSTS